jgi:flavodoxin
MKTCVLYFSQTGNTKMFAETISEALKIQALYDINVVDPSVVADYDVLILGTPVHGFNPSKEALAFVKSLPKSENKESILFCTYRLWKGSTFGKLKKELKNKGYNTVLCVGSKAKEFTKKDFVENVKHIEKQMNK